MSTNTDFPSEQRRWIALRVLLVAAAMDLFGATVVTLALPAIRDDLDASEAGLQWIIAGYGLAFAVGLITGCRRRERGEHACRPVSRLVSRRNIDAGEPMDACRRAPLDVMGTQP